MRDSFLLALNNIVRYGDTDIFPFPYETRLFDDMMDEVADSLVDTNNMLETRYDDVPPVNFSTCTTVGYTGYRWATQIDPYWNAFYLGLVIAIADNIEVARLSREYVYSYRFLPDIASSSLFDASLSWRTFQQDSFDLCKSAEDVKYVVSCDIADFYHRIYHRPLEYALDRVDPIGAVASKVKKLLHGFADGTLYGLPVGGPASRILAELALDCVDQTLVTNRVRFKRYVDDFLIFCESENDAHACLMLLNRTLMESGGFILQRSKTTVMRKEEFISLTDARLRGADGDAGSPTRAQFLSLSIRYDPYSNNAAEQYEEIKNSLEAFDLVGMLSIELQKSKIDQAFSKQLIRAFGLMNEAAISDAFSIVFDDKNFAHLYPIFITMLQVATTNWHRINPKVRREIRETSAKLIREESFILATDVNLAYLIRLFARENDPQCMALVGDIYKSHRGNMLIAMLATQAMGRCGVYDWIADQAQPIQSLNPWQRRALIVCSYLLGVTGETWRKENETRFTFIDELYSKWAARRAGAGDLAEAL